MKLPEFSVKQPVATMMLFLAIVIIGVFSLFRLNIDMFPDISPPVVSILTTWPGASAADVETEVTKAIEDEVNAASNLDTLTSKSLDNLSVVICKFDWGTSLDEATNDIRDKLELAKRALPDDVELPMLYRFSSATAPVMFITISGDQSWPRLFRLVDKGIGDELRRVPGVGAIQLYGGQRRRINVYFDLKKIEAYHLTLAGINEVLASENLNIPSGNIKSGMQEYFLRVPGRFREMEEIGATIVGYHRGRPVYLHDVARVEDDFKPMELNGWGDGKPAIVMLLQKQTGRNTVEVIQRVEKKLDAMKAWLPSDVQINIVLNNAEDILTSIRNLRETLMWGIALVVLVTLLFLRQFRASLIIALAIPGSLIISFIFLYLFDYTINLTSLMALAIGAGMVVDNGVVVLENIIRHQEQGEELGRAAMAGAGEMGLAITASTMTTVVVFVPLMFLEGLAGIIFKQLGFVIIITLLASLFTALSLTPMLSSRWIRQADDTNGGGILRVFHRWSEKGFLVLERSYGVLLGWALGRRKTVFLLAVAVFVSSLSLIPFLSTSFMPAVDSGSLSIDLRLAEGTRIEETNQAIVDIFSDIDGILLPGELRHSYAFDGHTETGKGVALGFDEGTNVGQVGLKLVDRDQRRRSVKEVAMLVRQRIERLPGITKLKVTDRDPVSAILMGNVKPVALEIQGSNIDEVVAFARRVAVRFAAIPGLVDISISQKDPRPELWINIDREKAAALGLRVASIAMPLRNYFYGREATRYRDAGDSFAIFTRLASGDKDNLETLLNVPLTSVDGRTIRLRNVVAVAEGSGPIEIERKNRQKIVRVEADLFQRSLGAATADIKKVLGGMDIPLGISTGFGGDIEEQKKAFADLTLLLVLGIVLVYMVMASLFGNLRDPFIVMFSVPFAFTGVLYAFYLTNTTLGIISFMGVVMLMGIVVNNAIVLLDYIHQLKRRGTATYAAVVEAGRSRLRPVLMTTLTTFFGMLPMAVSHKVGAEVWNPLGITMLGGLAVSTLVTLVLIPTVYYQLESRREQ
ncbi:MAG: efflux RND transporter permease subunit [Deltaproteobacteria bacterium]|nr:efflux RND transporter permease subunit [Candidatus Anaeroferrophillus wilburensis]MBN2887986.1 efflux RND transporter permease subunit [Deltaproteobacteria bacterium]